MFCYAPTTKAKGCQPDLIVSGSGADDWTLDFFDHLGKIFPLADDRVKLGLAFDDFTRPKEQVVSFYEKARHIGAKVITSHYVRTVFSESNQSCISYPG